MSSRRLPSSQPDPFVCHAKHSERVGNAPPAASFVTAQEAHPGWRRATEILLAGLARLEERERQAEAYVPEREAA